MTLILPFHMQRFHFCAGYEHVWLIPPSRKKLLAQLLGVLSADNLQMEVPSGRQLPFPRSPLPGVSTCPMADLGGSVQDRCSGPPGDN